MEARRLTVTYTAEQLAAEPAIRREQERWVRRYEALRFPKGTRRRTDHRVKVTRFNIAGDRVG
jgi:hypothetical protein